MLKEVLFIDFLVDDKGVIHKPVPEPGDGLQYLGLFALSLHVEIGYYRTYWGTHGCTLNLFKELALEGEIGAF